MRLSPLFSSMLLLCPAFAQAQDIQGNRLYGASTKSVPWNAPSNTTRAHSNSLSPITLSIIRGMDERAQNFTLEPQANDAIRFEVGVPLSSRFCVSVQSPMMSETPDSLSGLSLSRSPQISFKRLLGATDSSLPMSCQNNAAHYNFMLDPSVNARDLPRFTIFLERQMRIPAWGQTMPR
jgi:hypothetical protein